MAQIIDENPSALSNFGLGLGKGINKGVQNLAQSKIDELNRKYQQREKKQESRKAFQGVFNDELSEFLSNFEPDQQVKILDSLGKSGSLAGLSRQSQNESANGIPSSNNSGMSTLSGFQNQLNNANPSNLAQALSAIPEKEQRERRKESREVQDRIDKKNAPVVKDLRSNFVVAQGITEKVNEALELLKRDDIQYGYLYSKLPQKTLNAPTQRLSGLYGELALAEAAKLARATNYTRQAIEAIKPGIDQPLSVQRKRLESIGKSAKEIQDQHGAYETLINENGGDEPANLDLKIQNFLKKNGRAASETALRSQEPQDQQVQPEEAPQHELNANSPRQQPEENLAGTLGRNVVANLVKATQGAAGLAGIPGSLESLIPKGGGQILPTIEDVQGKIGRAAESVLPEGYLKPRGVLERGINDFSENVGALAPKLLSGGIGAALPAAERAAVAAFGKSAGRELVGGPWSELIGSIVASMGYDFWKKGFNGILNVARGRTNKEKEAVYSEARNAIADNNIRTTSAPLRDATHDIYDRFSDRLSAKEAKELLADFSKVESALGSPQVSAQKIWDAKIMLNRAIGEIEDPFLKVPYIELSNTLKNTLNDLGKKFPEFGVPFSKGESYTTGLKFMSGITKALKNVTGSKYYLSKIMLNGLNVLGGGQWAPLGKLAGIKGATKISDALDFARSPAGKKALAQAATEAIFGDKYGIARTLRDFERAINKSRSDDEEEL
jgi:hypothetical protein